MSSQHEVSAALRKIARGFDALADALAGEAPAEGERELPALREWGDRGLTRAQASALFRKHGFAPQTAGGWARGDWIESREDGCATSPTALGNGSPTRRQTRMSDRSACGSQREATSWTSTATWPVPCSCSSASTHAGSACVQRASTRDS